MTMAIASFSSLAWSRLNWTFIIVYMIRFEMIWNPIHYPLYSIDNCLSCAKLIFCTERLLEAASIEEGFFIFGFAFGASESELQGKWRCWDESWILWYERFSHSFGINLIWFLCYWGVCGLKAWDQVKRKDKIESLLFFKKKRCPKRWAWWE